jgi:hypothetical protein
VPLAVPAVLQARLEVLEVPPLPTLLPTCLVDLVVELLVAMQQRYV